MSDWLGGSPHDVALDFGGGAVRFRELVRAVGRVDLPDGDGAVGCPAGTDPVALVTTVLAALDRGRPVLVGGAQHEADVLHPRLPTGTELALLTSGSSGVGAAPRVVARTSESWLASARPLADVAGLDSGDRIAVTGPLHVSMHLYAVLHALWLGATASDDLRTATAMHATPTRLARVLDGDVCPPAVVVAGAATNDVLRSQSEARGIRFTEYYGAAELSFVLAGRPGGLEPFPGVEVDLRPGPAVDELWARSPYLALGTVGGGMLRRDHAGFATVGDLAERTPSGAICVLGRGDAAITTAGATVLAEHVEAKLCGLPGVTAAAVVGEPHDLLGQRVVAVVELADGARLDEVAAAAREQLSAAELPRRWFARALPRTDSGKVARGAVREALAAGELGAGHPVALERSAS
ncbi:class I adenylate-forming enzyme family protein [Agromyces sp. NPDC057865]|uniref:class I adenylate-forming enzyme family protein n=1 Tax=Agromyces sp. NPDC057865 TaxID=3346267 RepID=UPI00366F2711